MRFVKRSRREVGGVRRRGRPSDIRVGILLPIPYRAAISSLFMHIAYNTLNTLEDVVAYRYVYNHAEDVVEALESDAPNPKDLDLLLISLPYELDYPYAIRSLHIVDIDVRRRRRAKPLVIGGGIAAYSNPAPLANFLDAVAIGDGEKLLEELPYAVRDGGLEALCDLKHVLVYGLCDERIPKNIASVNGVPEAVVNQIHPLDEEPIYGWGVRIEVSKGCPRLCAFCLEGHVTKPFRIAPLDQLLNGLEKALLRSPWRRVVVYSLSLLDVPYAKKLLNVLAEAGVEVSVPSLRPDLVDEDIAELLKRVGQRTMTIAPESMDPETACRVGKCYDPEKLRNVIEKASSMGLNVKLYLVAGLPGESEEAFVENVKKFVESLSSRARARLRLSINPLVPKPWTPMQFLSPTYPELVGKRIAKLLRGIGVEYEVLSWRECVAQAAVALGGRDLAQLLIEMGVERTGLHALRSYAKKMTVSFEWMDMVDLGIDADYLRRRFEDFSSLDPRFSNAGASNAA